MILRMLSFVLLVAFIPSLHSAPEASKPNIVLILADDLGYGDLSSYGHPSQEPGPIDQLAANGIRFTQAYAQAVFCTPSRAALLTGRQPFRTGMVGPDSVHLPSHNIGLPHDEVTIAEVLRDAGYKTGMVGKWHQGINKESRDDGFFLPHTQGFEYVGTILPWTLSASCDTSKVHHWRPNLHACFVYHNATPVQQPIKLEQLSAAIAHDAQAFVYNATAERRPFFLYYAAPQTHTPMFNRDEFRGASRRGIYGDQIAELQWGVGALLSAMSGAGAHRDTLVVFASDHGPHRERGIEGGATGGLKGGKGNFFEGGLRVPLVASWPGRILRPHTDHSVVSLMDLLPTFAHLAGATLPDDRPIDGVSFAHLLLDEDPTADDNEPTMANSDPPAPSKEAAAPPPHEPSPRMLPFFCSQLLMAVRYGAYKLHLHQLPAALEKEMMLKTRRGGIPLFDWYHAPECWSAVFLDPPELYNVEHDPGELYPLDSHEHAHTVAEIRRAAAEYLDAVGADMPRMLLSSDNRRYALRPCCNPPFCLCVNDLHTYNVCPR